MLSGFVFQPTFAQRGRTIKIFAKAMLTEVAMIYSKACQVLNTLAIRGTRDFFLIQSSSFVKVTFES